MSEQSHDRAGVGQPGSSVVNEQPTTEQADRSTGYPEADQEFTQSINEPGEGGEDPRPENPTP